MSAEPADAPRCPVHGRMHFREPRGCGAMCGCYPCGWTCPGWDGEGCAHEVTMREFIAARLRALPPSGRFRMPAGELRRLLYPDGPGSDAGGPSPAG